MDFTKLNPDFNALGRLDYSKPVIDTKNTIALIALVAAVLSVVFVFLPWFSMKVSMFGQSVSASRLGITTWYGIIGLIMALTAVAGVLYKQYALAFWAAVICVVLGFIGWLSYASLTMDGRTVTADDIKLALAANFGAVSIGHLGAILFFFSSAIAAVCSLLMATGRKIDVNLR